MRLPQEIIRDKRNGASLAREDIVDFIQAMTKGELSEGQVAAFAMAVWFRGMTLSETVALTVAMRDSGRTLSYPGIDRPIADKHSTGGVGDNVSLILAPLAAACGLAVPMISGRGLGHTGGTLDKLESIPGYQITQEPEALPAILRQAGCAIIGQSGDLAPADKRLYAIRDVTATVDSPPLITASILSKKLAAGLETLVLDVKLGNGSVVTTRQEAEDLAQLLTSVANGAGLKTSALITDMNEPLADAAGNALEVMQAIHVLAGRRQGSRLEQVVLAFAAEMLLSSGVVASLAEGEAMALTRLRDGAAAECFSRMVSALGGPADLMERPQHHLARAPVIRDVPAPASGWLSGIDTRALGMEVIALKGGRLRPDDSIDHRVGFDAIRPMGTRVLAGEPIAVVHAADEDAAARAIARLQALVLVGDSAPQERPLVYQRIGA